MENRSTEFANGQWFRANGFIVIGGLVDWKIEIGDRKVENRNRKNRNWCLTP